MAKYFIDYRDRHNQITEIVVEIADSMVIDRGDYLCYKGSVQMGNGDVIREPQITKYRKHPIIQSVVVNRV